MRKFWLSAVTGIAMIAPAQAATIITRMDVTVVSNEAFPFHAPIFRYFNLSDPGINVDRVRMSGGAPWDYVLMGNSFPPELRKYIPNGGSMTIYEGEERTINPNNGCTAGIGYNFTGFNPGEFAGYTADPESSSCGNVGVDVRPFLDSNTSNNITIEAAFSDGAVLSSRTWIAELIDPNGDPNDFHNQRFRLTLERQTTVDDPPPPAVPEPASWAMMLLGFGLAGSALRSSNKSQAGKILVLS